MSQDKEQNKNDVEMQEEAAAIPEQKSGYYINRPVLGKGEQSKLRQQLGREKSLFIVIVIGIVFYFTMLRIQFQRYCG